VSLVNKYLGIDKRVSAREINSGVVSYLLQDTPAAKDYAGCGWGWVSFSNDGVALKISYDRDLDLAGDMRYDIVLYDADPIGIELSVRDRGADGIELLCMMSCWTAVPQMQP